MITYVDVLRPTEHDLVLHQTHRALVVLQQQRGLLLLELEVLQDATQKHDLGCTVGGGVVLCLGGRYGHWLLQLAHPAHRTVVQEAHISRMGLARVGAPTMVSVGVGGQHVVHLPLAVPDAQLHGALEVAQHMQSTSIVRGAGVGHHMGDLGHRHGNVRPRRDRAVQQTAHQTAIRQSPHLGTLPLALRSISCGEHGPRVQRHRSRLAILHPEASQHVLDVLGLPQQN
mmetsp:Transcript_33797/g.73892  ORF Transcript_33797/g.73892 Transcript_33797/m.73892 type:complete len:228 (-) Transcript_33797:3798-4481(-)